MQDVRIGEILCQMGVIGEEDIEGILRHQRQTRQKFGQIAIRLGMATHEQVWEAWARQLAEQERIELDDIDSDTPALEMVPLSTASQIGLVPLRLWGKHLVVAAPPDVPQDVLAELADSTQCRIHVCTADRRAVQDRLQELTDRAGRLEETMLMP